MLGLLQATNHSQRTKSTQDARTGAQLTHSLFYLKLERSCRRRRCMSPLFSLYPFFQRRRNKLIEKKQSTVARSVDQLQLLGDGFSSIKTLHRRYVTRCSETSRGNLQKRSSTRQRTERAEHACKLQTRRRAFEAVARHPPARIMAENLCFFFFFSFVDLTTNRGRF
ncbi:hypothetical protein GUJ93_ZPchr0009g2196 [Zizania palustris]|uniref:Uncharacterized protein n=1 Tax=Zizania palustris TaxID=103762 RepID=A0A8J5V3C4_ZIZPA|nr:hypothetical protein GUJ93_ZPchr0009g2196 [Zizania palustris]